MLDHLIAVLPGFLLACVALAALPGPATALFLHRTLRDGRRAGLAAVAGNEIGLWCWAVAGGAGFSALLQANRILSDGLHVAGGLVLVVLGVRAWRDSRHGGGDPEAPSGPAAPSASSAPSAPSRGDGTGAAFRASLVSIAANPKAAVFAISFFPAFLPRTGPVMPTVLVLATIQVAFDTCWCSGIVLAAERAGRWLRRARIRRRLERTLATILIALGIDLALQTR